MRKVPFTLLIAFLFLPTASAGDPFAARCVGVTDGDTITVLTPEKQEIRIRIEGIDCPEGSQDFSRKAKDFTSALVFGKTVTIQPKEYDDYGRLVGRVEADGIDLSLALVTAGLAWHFKRYDSDPVLARAEEVARAAQIGIFSMPDPIPPWLYRSGTRQVEAEPEVESGGIVYHGNVNSKVFHAPGCQHYDCKNCTRVLNSKEEAERLGYRPHAQCVQ